MRIIKISVRPAPEVACAPADLVARLLVERLPDRAGVVSHVSTVAVTEDRVEVAAFLAASLGGDPRDEVGSAVAALVGAGDVGWEAVPTPRH